MKVITPEISWHEREPIYSVDFQPRQRSIQRIASGGVDKVVRIWQMTLDNEGKGLVDFLSNLRRHTATVNVVRFSKTGDLLASAGDDNTIILWKLSDASIPANNIFAEEDAEEDKELWVCHKTLRGHLGDVADLSWSKDDRYLVSGSVDNCAVVWDVVKGIKLALFNEHKSYVQGVAFDPLGYYVATLSADRSMRLYNFNSKNCVHNVSKMILPSQPSATAGPISEAGTPQAETKPKPFRLFHDDSLRSFFRRLDFSPDGQLLMAPAGVMELGEGKTVNASYVFARGAFTKPALYLPSVEKTTTVIRVNPQLFELRPVDNQTAEEKTSEAGSEKEKKTEWEKHKSIFCLPYRVVYAVATEDSVLIYDTQQTMPVGLLKNIHYCQISDLSWTSDGMALIIASTDGFCTIATFDADELGVPYVPAQDSTTLTPAEKGTLPSVGEENMQTPTLNTKTSKGKGAKLSQGSQSAKKKKGLSKTGKGDIPKTSGVSPMSKERKENVSKTPTTKKIEKNAHKTSPKSELQNEVEALKIEDVEMEKVSAKSSASQKEIPNKSEVESPQPEDMEIEKTPESAALQKDRQDESETKQNEEHKKTSPQTSLKDEGKDSVSQKVPKKRIQLTTLSLISKT